MEENVLDLAMFVRILADSLGARGLLVEESTTICNDPLFVESVEEALDEVGAKYE